MSFIKAEIIMTKLQT